MTERSQLPLTLKLMLHEVPHARFPVDTQYVETFWLPRLGPSAYVLLRRCSTLLANARARYPIDVPSHTLASMVGIGGSLGPNASLARSIERLVHYEIAVHRGHVLAVACLLPPLPDKHLLSLPSLLRDRHRTYLKEIEHAAK